jgi:CMP-N-acetylneuraminic acid synthetase
MYEKKKIVAFVFARGGSKQIPKKNLALIDGKPLLQLSIELAKKVDAIDEIVVSTDCDEIASMAKLFGASVPFKRPLELATDTSSEFEAWKHAVNYFRENGRTLDVFLSLPTTAPLRSVADIELCIYAFCKYEPDVLVTMTDAQRNPVFNIARQNNDGYLKLAIDGVYSTRQSAPTFYDLTTVAYMSTPKFILENNHIFDGNVMGVKIPAVRGLDIDNQLDLEFARFLSGDQQLLNQGNATIVC